MAVFWEEKKESGFDEKYIIKILGLPGDNAQWRKRRYNVLEGRSERLSIIHFKGCKKLHRNKRAYSDHLYG